ncbi:F-box/kelch-repeat protein At3g23880-like isoform X1 [Quercus robur]|uniref:F-box/kelch-repeat protein At3g23880-like isoform X1 n=1 Tax=Quercus robur TaxID=38942 RepID=UPI002162FA04|nr:F-box/kelch-repeat protein At3g23880-like isoform X1 [Quercus robur]
MMDLEYLPYDVLLEILHRLPVKSLIRFRCVSKSWNSLITSPAFINSNLTRTRSHSDSNKLIVRYLDVALRVERYKLIHEDNDNNVSSSEEIQDLKLPLRSSRLSYFQLVGSANGLFCLYEGNRCILWNPCIRKFITLPNPSVTAEFFCYLAFGFDSRTNDYKVVRIAYKSDTRYEGAKPPLVEVYSVNEGSWRVTSGGDSYPPKITMSIRPQQAASLNGAVYFVANDWGNAQSFIVLSFDLGDEVFRLICLPYGKFGSDDRIFTSEFKGLLSLICYESWHYIYSIWVMKEYGIVDSWTKQFTIDLNMQYWKVLRFWKNDHVLVQKMQSGGLMLFSYDPESQQVKNLGFCKSTGCSYADNYVENLVLLDKPNEVVPKEESEQEEEVQSVGCHICLRWCWVIVFLANSALRQKEVLSLSLFSDSLIVYNLLAMARVPTSLFMLNMLDKLPQ